jgi:virulence-associated protein VapD
LNKILNKLGIGDLNSKVIKEKSHLFDQKFLNIDDESYVIGDFFSEKYFKDIRDILLKQFKVKDSPSEYMRNMESEIYGAGNSCCVHVRRGDYFYNKKVNKVHGVCSAEYYHNAIKYIQSQVGDIQCFIFSNDIEWCKKNLKIDNVIYMENKERKSPHEDIHLMSLCKHNIIDHSSFCWWGAWLNQNSNKIVVAPQRWFSNEKLQKQSRDIYCKDWVKI